MEESLPKRPRPRSASVTGGTYKPEAEIEESKPSEEDDAKPVEIVKSGNAVGLARWDRTNGCRPEIGHSIGLMSFQARACRRSGIPLIGYNQEAYKVNTRKGIRWTAKQ